MTTGNAWAILVLIPFMLARWLLVREAAPGWLLDGRAGPRAGVARLWLDILLPGLACSAVLPRDWTSDAGWAMAGQAGLTLLAVWVLSRAWAVSPLSGALIAPAALNAASEALSVAVGT